VIYYPYATIHSDECLFRAALYFDKIKIIRPQTARAGNESLKFTTLPNPHIDDLEKEKIVEYVYPDQLFRGPRERFISDSIKSDLDDPQFKRLCELMGGTSWTIYAEKVPLDGIFMKFLQEYPPLFKDTDPLENRKLIEELIQKFDNENIVTVPFDLGESIMINHALSATIKWDDEYENEPKIQEEEITSPFTDRKFHNGILRHKLERLNQDQAYRQLLYDAEITDSVNADLTAFTVIDEMVPSLKKIEFNELVKFRKDNEGSLSNFRKEMKSRAEDIQTHHWGIDFKTEIKEKLIPEIQDEFDELRRDIRTGFFDRIIGTFYPANPIMGQLEAKIQRKQRIKNGLSYLLDIEDTFGVTNNI